MWRIKLGCLGAFAALVLFAAAKGCSGPVSPVPRELLHDDDRRAISINTRQRQVVIMEPGKKPIIKEGVRNAEVHIKRDGSVEYVARSWGPTFEPGVVGFVSHRDFLWGVDASFGYCSRFTGNVGLGLHQSDIRSIRGLGSIAYQLPFRYTPNTSLFVGETTDLFKDVSLKGFIENFAFGLRIAL